MIMQKNRGNILIVDDQPELLHAYSRIIKKSGYKTFTAENGKEAFELINSESIDLILLDVVLPDINGFQILVELKSRPETNNIFVVLISSKVKSTEKQAEGLEAGADGYLVKPINARELTARIHSFMKHKHTINELKHSEERFKKISDKIIDAILITDRDGIIQFINPAAEKLFNKNKKELMSSVFGHPIIAGEKTEISIVNKKNIEIIGELRSVEIIWNNEKMVLASIRDVTDRKKHEQEIHDAYEETLVLNDKYVQLNKKLEEKSIKLEKFNNEIKKAKNKSEKSEQKFRLIIESINDGFFVLSKNNFKIILFNQIACQIFNCTGKEVVGKPFFKVFNDLKSTLFEEKFKECIAKNTFVQFEEYIDKEPFFNWYNARIYPSEQGISIFLQVTTDKKSAEKELIIAKNKAEESDLLKTAFLQNMSHEIRTPMNAIVGFSEIIVTEKVSDDEKLLYSSYIKSNSESLIKIIDDIIDISKLQNSQLTLKITDFDLILLFKEFLAFYNQVLKKNNSNKFKLELIISSENEEVFIIRADKYRLKQVVNNLISNAIKYAKFGSISFGFKKVDNQIYFFVKDTGQGIPMDKQSEIFNRFVQVSNEYVARHEGTGLGLPISKELVKLMGGELKLESEPDKGSLFYFYLPYVSSNATLKKEVSSLKRAIKSDLSAYKILIADDEDSNYVLTKRILKPSKVTTDWAQNGKQAVEMAANNKYDLILMDIKMPEMDGIEATRLIKKHNKNIPIVIQTAFAMKEVKDEAIEAGCNGFIVKPIALDAFLELVRKHIK